MVWKTCLRKLSRIGSIMGESAEKQGYSYGTFKGVYTPSVLTFFGVIMYLLIPSMTLILEDVASFFKGRHED